MPFLVTRCDVHPRTPHSDSSGASNDSITDVLHSHRHYRKLKAVLAILDPLYSGRKKYNFSQDASHLLLLELAQRGYKIFYASPKDLSLTSQELIVHASVVKVTKKAPYFYFSPPQKIPSQDFSLILMRKDPPVDKAYHHACELLCHAKTLVLNSPQALLTRNEKLFILDFPRWIPPTLVSSSIKDLFNFIHTQKTDCILKPLHLFAGQGILRISSKTKNLKSILKQKLKSASTGIMIQKFLPQISQGEKRVFMIEGKAMGAILKIPTNASLIANPDRGATIQKTKLTAHEIKLCREVGKVLQKEKIFFAGLDLIDEKLTEINITSPGLLWEWRKIDGHPYERDIVDRLENYREENS